MQQSGQTPNPDLLDLGGYQPTTVPREEENEMVHLSISAPVADKM
jgi:hypothetical protein